MNILLIVTAAVIGCFAFVVLFGAPYVPTLRPQKKQAFELLALKPGQTLLELGSGDGGVMVEAARRGYKVIGYELNPILYLIAWFRLLPYRRQAKLYCRNFWRVQLPEADGIFVFLLEKYMGKLDEKISRETVKPLTLVSYAFAVGHKKPYRQSEGMLAYKYIPKKA